MEINSPDLLFVYGTLLPGAESPLKAYMEECCDVVGEAWLNGTIAEINGYPALITHDNSSRVVHGTLLRLKNPAASFKIIDDYEGIGDAYPQPWEYLREIRRVNHKSETINAWVYVLNPSYYPKSFTTS